VTAQNTSPQLAADIANSTGRALIRLTETINTGAAAANLPTILPTVRAEVVQAAVVPVAPSGGTRTANLVGGILAGLLLGLALVLVRKLVDSAIRSGAELVALTSAPAVGAMPYARGVDVRPLCVMEEPDGKLAAAYRELRVNVGACMSGHRAVALMSTRSDEGRTLSVSNLAIAFAESGCRVAVLEADLRRPRLGEYFGFDDLPGLAEVLNGTQRTADVVRSWQGRLNVVLAGRDRNDPGRLMASPRLLHVLNDLKRDHDVVLIDTPAVSTASDLSYLAASAEAVLILAGQGRARSAAVGKLAATVRLASGNIIGSVLTLENAPWHLRWPVRRQARASLASVPARPAEVALSGQSGYDGQAAVEANGHRVPSPVTRGPSAPRDQVPPPVDRVPTQHVDRVPPQYLERTRPAVGQAAPPEVERPRPGSGVEGSRSAVEGTQSGVDGTQSELTEAQPGAERARPGVERPGSGVEGGRSAVEGTQSGVDGTQSEVKETQPRAERTPPEVGRPPQPAIDRADPAAGPHPVPAQSRPEAAPSPADSPNREHEPTHHS
jgi:Mrp family chromosome partitioning ATPase